MEKEFAVKDDETLDELRKKVNRFKEVNDDAEQFLKNLDKKIAKLDERTRQSDIKFAKDIMKASKKDDETASARKKESKIEEKLKIERYSKNEDLRMELLRGEITEEEFKQQMNNLDKEFNQRKNRFNK